MPSTVTPRDADLVPRPVGRVTPPVPGFRLLLRRSALGYATAPGLLVFLALTCLPVLATPAVRLARGEDPGWGVAVPLGVILVATSAVLCRTLLAAAGDPPAGRWGSWQANKVATLGARLTGQHMPLTARADFAVLAALEEYGRLSQAALGRRLGLDRNDVSTVLARLEQDRSVTRKPDPANLRRNIVAVTRTGLRQLAGLQVHADAVQDELLGGLDVTERAHLVGLLDKVLAQHPAQPA